MHDLVVISDLHLGRGKNPHTGRYHELEAFFYDDDFRSFCQWLLDDATKRNVMLRLVINGDGFDLLRIDRPPQTPEATFVERRFGPFLTPDRAACDITEILGLMDPAKALYCVQHDYTPANMIKMDGKQQTVYPRKNWSSFMLFNCAHPSTRQLTVETVNSQTGAYLHRMQWAADEEIGSIPTEWNWLEGWNEKPAAGTPKAVHYTRGGPWFENWQDVDYADVWKAEAEAVRQAGLAD